ncbi:MAG: tail fiber protein [Phycisphaerales bacterium]|nr:tail fiber protein [Phycisphaerales bacterium]
MPPIPFTVFVNNDVLLRIWFDDGAGNGVHQLTPDEELNSAPYVFRALDSDRATDAEHAETADVAEDSALLNGFSARELTPAGSIVAYAGATAPTGWLLCNGSTISRAANADLFAAIGTAYGTGDGSTTFHLPDLRGRFLRGVTGGTANDPNAATRTASNAGGNAGNNIGSLQTDATSLPTASFINSTIAAHTHTISGGSHSHTLSGSGEHDHFGSMRASAGGAFNTEPASGNPAASNLGLFQLLDGGGHTHTVNTDTDHAHTASSAGSHAHTISGGDVETRPVNVYVNWIIKR